MRVTSRVARLRFKTVLKRPVEVGLSSQKLTGSNGRIKMPDVKLHLLRQTRLGLLLRNR